MKSVYYENDVTCIEPVRECIEVAARAAKLHDAAYAAYALASARSAYAAWRWWMLHTSVDAERAVGS